MRIKSLQPALILAGLMLTAASVSFAQTSVAASIYGAFNGSTTGNGVQQSPSNSAGTLIELRHISNPLIGYEGTYSYNRDNQVYRPTVVGCGIPCGNPTPQPVSANAHEITGDWIASVHIANVRPFALAGIGVLLNEPSGNSTATTSSTKAVYIYGAGLDWGVLPHLGLRFQYRGNLYKAPNMSRLFTSTNAFTQTAEPMIGAYFNF